MKMSFANCVANQKAGDDDDMSDTDAWVMIADLKADVFDTIFPDEEEVDPKLQQLENFMQLLTEDQRNLIYEHANSELNRFALLFEFDSDVKHIRHVLPCYCMEYY